MGSSSHAILYVGGFVLPDGNAAAQRVLANAKLFLELGFEVFFLNRNPEILESKKVVYNNFECLEYPASEWNMAVRTDIDYIEEAVSLHPEIDCIVAYNYPSPLFAKLLRFCAEHGIKCLGDITEWYRARDTSLAKRPAKFLDTFLRMRVLNKKCDGLIVISNFLEDYYQGLLPVLNLPPLVDSSDSKWTRPDKAGDGLTRLVYAGKPSKTKERLDLIVETVADLPNDCEVVLDIVGVTLNECEAMYGRKFNNSPRVIFHGRVPHEEALNYVLRADHSFVVRDDNRVTKAGFPTKFVESVTCGTAVICNDNGDLRSWVESIGCGSLVAEQTLLADLKEIIKARPRSFDRSTFDYRRFTDRANEFFDSLFIEKG